MKDRRDHHSGWTDRGRRRWDLPPNVTKVLLALVGILASAVAHAYVK